MLLLCVLVSIMRKYRASLFRAANSLLVLSQTRRPQRFTLATGCMPPRCQQARRSYICDIAAPGYKRRMIALLVELLLVGGRHMGDDCDVHATMLAWLPVGPVGHDDVQLRLCAAPMPLVQAHGNHVTNQNRILSRDYDCFLCHSVVYMNHTHTNSRSFYVLDECIQILPENY